MDWLARRPGALAGSASPCSASATASIRFLRRRRRLRRRVRAAGAERIATLALADEIAGQSDTVKQWLEMFAKLWAADGQAARARRAVVELIPPRAAAARPARSARIAFNTEMLGPEPTPDRSTRHIGIDLAPGRAGYAAGDHVAVHPVNPAAWSRGSAAHLGLPRDAWFRMLGASAPR